MEQTAEYTYLTVEEFAAAAGLDERRVLHLIRLGEIVALRPAHGLGYQILDTELVRYKDTYGATVRRKPKVPLRRHEALMVRMGRLRERLQEEKRTTRQQGQELARERELRQRLQRELEETTAELARLKDELARPWWKRLVGG